MGAPTQPPRSHRQLIRAVALSDPRGRQLICLGIILAIDVLKPNVDEVALRYLCAMMGSLEICLKSSNAQRVSEKAARVIDLSAGGATYAGDAVLAGHLADHKLRVSLHQQAADAVTLSVLQSTD